MKITIHEIPKIMSDSAQNQKWFIVVYLEKYTVKDWGKWNSKKYFPEKSQ